MTDQGPGQADGGPIAAEEHVGAHREALGASARPGAEIVNGPPSPDATKAQ
ncbi:MAG: hypothetical protein ACK5LS_08930 [Propioniciclava sp.]